MLKIKDLLNYFVSGPRNQLHPLLGPKEDTYSLRYLFPKLEAPTACLYSFSLLTTINLHVFSTDLFIFPIRFISHSKVIVTAFLKVY